jgi:outer membrane protein assembly factor BamE (lipoprotein component of BamABCDE complex)
MKMTRGACLMSAVLLAGCASINVGREFDYSRFSNSVQRGATDAKQVTEWLGAPMGRGTEITPDGQRLQVWTWYYGRGQVGAAADREFKMLQVKVNDQGKVVGYVWSGELAGGPAVEDRSPGK